MATDKPNQASNNSTEASQLSNDVESTPEKIKPPKLEDKPFKEFIVEDFIPAIETSLRKFDVPSQTICFEESDRPVTGGKCWVVYVELSLGRRFWLCFSEDKITSIKNIVLAESGSEPSLLESFLIDERKITLQLLVSRLMQRLNGQKWLGRN